MRATHVTAALLCLATALAGTLFGPWAATAYAQEDRVEPLGGKNRGYESPQNFELEVRFSPYKPNVDSDPKLNGQTPYETVFGTDPRFFVGAELDWQVLRIPHFGTLGPGVSAGYTKASDPAMFTMPHNGTTISGETTSLTIFPFAAMAVLRVDVLWREVRIPLVPYVKAGISYALWRASNTLGTSSVGGVSGTGFSLGTHLAVGLSFNLNPLDRYAAQNFDDAMGVNATYLFAEFNRDDYQGLGVQSDPLRVGGSNWVFGFALEF